ncbi:hypothetical protein [Prauserella muralis]|uniref:Uncharacterized protein n=1 Tax=Prauserella muralis TaxID=588067 RepID=A0A2V4AP02_9PSEU|nr:hypothetical protein [Prauserella muralis]PXY20866.1 hypothetical protein BAY60_25520 [Prauserella muralis]TWE29906.1 hypothetical protein FHX69_2599 [Prauserella muralis]
MAKLSTIKRNDSRFYVNKETGEKVPGVTSIVDMIPKPFLMYWAAKMAAEYTVDNIGSVVQLLLDGQRDVAVDAVKGAPRRSTGDAAKVGTAVHDYFEQYARGTPPKRVPLDVQPFADHIAEFHDRYQPEYLYLEQAVWSESHNYAGSFDWIARIGDEIVIGDTKTTRSGVHAEVALQLAAYRHADKIVTQAGDEEPVPAINAGGVFHLRPEGWKLVPVRTDRVVFDHFLSLRHTFDWVKSLSGDVLGDPDYDSTAELSTGSQRRAK